MYSFNSNFTKFKENISLTAQDSKRLIDARRKIRGHIRKTFQEGNLRYTTLPDGSPPELIGLVNRSVTPRFMTQGSFSYGTINKPAKSKQRMDLDDGIYFPLTYVEEMSQVDFEKAATVLRRVVYEKAKDIFWECVLKPKCIRVIISSDAQIDLPIYSIPDEQLKTVTEAKARAGEFSSGSGTEVNLLSYDPAEGVLLATDDGWIESDPRVIHKWVQDSKEKHRKRFTGYSKFLKAWRDNQWVKSDFSSIMIMAGIEMALSEPDYEEEGNVARDLEFIVRKFLMYLSESGKGIKDPDGGARLDENLDNRKGIIDSLKRLADHLNIATKEGNVQLLVAEFGKRFPSSKGEERNVAPAAVSGAGSSSVISSPVVRPSRRC